MTSRREEGPEWLEEGDWPLEAVAANLADMARMSRWVGLTARLSRRVARWARGSASSLIVEVGCGRGGPRPGASPPPEAEGEQSPLPPHRLQPTSAGLRPGVSKK
ncbi:MAG: hypothetical protein ACE5JJ_00925 [Nitrospinota bacterium]